MKNSTIKSIDTIISQLVNENDLGNEFILSKLIEIWKSDFPAQLVANVRITRYESEVLYMISDYPPWRKEIILRNSDIMQQLNQHFGTQIIKKIHI